MQKLKADKIYLEDTKENRRILSRTIPQEEIDRILREEEE